MEFVDPVYRILAYPHTPFCTQIAGSLLKAPLTAREQRKKIWGAEEIGEVQIRPPQRIPTRKSRDGRPTHNLTGPHPRTLAAIATLAKLAFGTQGPVI
jgi:hypothetical protein